MSAISIKDRLPSEVGDSDTYNRLQLHRAVQSREHPSAETSLDAAGEIMRVLIVDSYRASANTMSMLVDIWGHDVRRAYDGPAGLALAAEFQPDVLLIDVVMPGMNGFELARQVRQQVRLNDCFMIAVTGRIDASYQRQGEEAGIDLFLLKPVMPSILQALLMWESAYVSQLRQSVPTYEVVPARSQQQRAPHSLSSTQLPCHDWHATVAS